MFEKEKGGMLSVVQIGRVQRGEGGIHLVIDEAYRSALKNLGLFSHVMVLWWAYRHDNPASRGRLETTPPYAQGHVMGVFATRAEYRPNPIALTTCKLLDVDVQQGVVKVAEIDALDGSPLIDMKAYFPVCDRVREVRIPDWLSDLPDWMPDEGLGLD